MDHKSRTITLQQGSLAVQEHLVEQAVAGRQVDQRVVDTLVAGQDTGAVDTLAAAGWDTSAAVHNLAAAAAVDHGLVDADHSLERESQR